MTETKTPRHTPGPWLAFIDMQHNASLVFDEAERSDLEAECRDAGVMVQFVPSVMAQAAPELAEAKRDGINFARLQYQARMCDVCDRWKVNVKRVGLPNASGCETDICHDCSEKARAEYLGGGR